MTKTQSRLERAQREVAKVAGLLAISVTQKKYSRTSMQESITRLNEAKHCIEDVLSGAE